MPQETFIEKQEEHIAIHIFTVSSAMVGVCLTVIGILNLSTSFKKIDSWADEITVVDAITFLIACILAYVSIKTKERRRRLLLERTADMFFLGGLALMIVICLFIVSKFA